MEYDIDSLKRDIRDPKKLKQFVFTITPYIIVYIIFIIFSSRLGITTESVKLQMERLDLPLWLVFILIQWTVSLTPLPDFPFLAAGIIFFPPITTFLLIWTGMWVATIMNFYIARSLGREWVRKRYPQTTKFVDYISSEYGLETVIVGRSFTFVAFDLIGYAAGISNMKVGKFAIASILGLIPVALNATLIGLALTSTLNEDVTRLGGTLRSIGYFLLSGSFALFIGFWARKYRDWLSSRS